MLKSAVTVSLVNEARGGPFVFWDDLPAAIRRARDIGFDAVELFAPGPDAVRPSELRSELEQAGMALAAVGTGAGWVLHKLSLTDPAEARRDEAIEFIRAMIDFGEPFGAPAVIGSMQGRWTGEVDRERALAFLGDALAQLEQHAADRGVPLIYEPLNRYETNLCNTLAEGAALIGSRQLQNTRLLADLFHMNIEEADLAAALRDAGGHVGHVHFVDSNRRPAGCGHIDYGPIAAALQEIDFDGYASAEAFPWPDSDAAAEQTLLQFRRTFRAE